MRGALLLAAWLIGPVLISPSAGAAQEFFTLKGHGGPIMGIAVAADGQIATASFDNTVGLWTGTEPHWLEGHAAAVNTVLFAHGTLFSAGDDFTVRQWPGGTVIGQHLGKVMGLTALPGAIVSASWDGTLGIWPLDDAGESQVLRGHKAGVNAVAYAPRQGLLHSAGADGTLRVWDAATGVQTRQLLRHGFGINEIVVNEDAGWLAYGAVDGVTRIIDLTTGTPLHDFTLERRPILALALSPDGHVLAVGDGEGYIMLIDTQAWQIADDFRATLRGPVWALAFSADGANIHAGGLDEAMYSWPVATLGAHGKIADSERSFLKDPAKMSNGERQFARKCSICHSLSPETARRAGPTLYGLFGRPAGRVPGYAYSNTLSSSDIIWQAESINALFDLGPDHYIPGSKMPMQRITNPVDRADLITYLRNATTGEPIK